MSKDTRLIDAMLYWMHDANDCANTCTDQETRLLLLGMILLMDNSLGQGGEHLRDTATGSAKLLKQRYDLKENLA